MHTRLPGGVQFAAIILAVALSHHGFLGKQKSGGVEEQVRLQTIARQT
jgi:hypothetical protein